MVDMAVAADDIIDVGGLDAGLFHALEQAAGGGAERFREAHAGVEHHQPVAEIHDRDVLLENDVVLGQEVGLQHAVDRLLGHADERAGRVAQRQRPVRHDGDLRRAEHEAVEVRGLGVGKRSLGERLAPDGQRAASGHRGGAGDECATAEFWQNQVAGHGVPRA
jgi:hypothetical protein